MRGEGAETAEAEADRDDAHVLDAAVGEEPLHVVLDGDEDRREDQRHEPEEQKDRVGLAVSAQGGFGNRQIAHDAE